MTPFDARLQAVRLLVEGERRGVLVDEVVGSWREKNRSDPQLGLVLELSKGTNQNRGPLSQSLNEVIPRGLDSLPIEIQSILLVALYQLRYLDRSQPELVVNESVELSKRFGSLAQSRLVNGVLRGLLRTQVKPTSGSGTGGTSRARGIPEWLFNRWCDRLGSEGAHSLCEAHRRGWPLSVRVNLLRTTPHHLMHRFGQAGLTATLGRWSRDCVVIDEGQEIGAVTSLPGFAEGEFFIQDQSSILVGTLVAPSPDQRVLDLCSAPGGKTTHLAEQMNDQGVIIACDSSSRRLARVQQNAARLGLHSIRCLATSGARPGIVGSFDSVLVDAPCSGLGVIGKKADIAWNKSEADILRLATVQSQLLAVASQYVSPAGTLIYSTCTTEPEENEEVVQSFLRRNSDFVVGQIVGRVPPECITDAGFLRTWPHLHGIAGGFAALLMRRD